MSSRMVARASVAVRTVCSVPFSNVPRKPVWPSADAGVVSIMMPARLLLRGGRRVRLAVLVARLHRLVEGVDRHEVSADLAVGALGRLPPELLRLGVHRHHRQPVALNGGDVLVA